MLTGRTGWAAPHADDAGGIPINGPGVCVAAAPLSIAVTPGCC